MKLWRWIALCGVYSALGTSVQAVVAQERPLRELALPAPTGGYAVGTWTTTLEDDARGEILTPEASDRRELVVQFWYPRDTSVAAPTRSYMDPSTAGTWVERHGFPRGFEVHVRTHAAEGAPVAPGGAPFPVLLFSHGLSWPVLMYQSLLEELASHGYVVAAINHTYASDMVVFADGRKATFRLSERLRVAANRDSVLAEYIGTWEDDIRFVAVELAHLNEGNPRGPLSGRLDLGRIGAFGHSYGGSAVALALDGSPLRAGIAMEGIVRAEGMRPLRMDKPFMHIIGGYNRLEMEGTQYRAGDAPLFEVVVNGAWHASFSDLILLYKPYADAAWRERHRYELEPGRTVEITRAYLRAFFDRYLLGKDSDLLHPRPLKSRYDSGRTSGYPEVEMRIDVAGR